MMKTFCQQQNIQTEFCGNIWQQVQQHGVYQSIVGQTDSVSYGSATQLLGENAKLPHVLRVAVGISPCPSSV